MVLSCCASGCNAKFVKGGEITFHSFPKDEKRRKLWEVQTKRKNFKASTYTKLCSKHFRADCFDRSKLGGTWLKADAVPTIFGFPSSPQEVIVEEEPLEPASDVSHIGSNISDTSVKVERSLKRKCYWGDFTEDDLSSPTRERKVLALADDSVRAYRRKIRNLNLKLNRTRKKVSSLKEILRTLKKKPSITNLADKVTPAIIKGVQFKSLNDVKSEPPDLNITEMNESPKEYLPECIVKGEPQDESISGEENDKSEEIGAEFQFSKDESVNAKDDDSSDEEVNDVELKFFKSLVPFIKHLPYYRKIDLQMKIQELVCQEIFCSEVRESSKQNSVINP